MSEGFKAGYNFSKETFLDIMALKGILVDR